MVQFLRLLTGPPDDRIETRHYFQRFRWTVVLSHAPLQVAVEFLRAGKGVLRCEHPPRSALPPRGQPRMSRLGTAPDGLAAVARRSAGREPRNARPCGSS